MTVVSLGRMLARLGLRAVAVLLAVAAACRASGAEAADDGKIRVLSFGDGETTSARIGDPVTPLCAVETFESCRARRVWAHCDAVGFDRSVYREQPVYGYSRFAQWRYRVLGSRVLTAADIPSWAGQTWRAGDMALAIRWWQCIPEDSCFAASLDDPKRAYGEGCPPVECYSWPHPFTYIVRGQGGRWRHVKDYAKPVLGEGFWKGE